MKFYSTPFFFIWNWNVLNLFRIFSLKFHDFSHILNIFIEIIEHMYIFPVWFLSAVLLIFFSLPKQLLKEQERWRRSIAQKTILRGAEYFIYLWKFISLETFIDPHAFIVLSSYHSKYFRNIRHISKWNYVGIRRIRLWWRIQQRT